jgi:hypothetical protein
MAKKKKIEGGFSDVAQLYNLTNEIGETNTIA